MQLQLLGDFGGRQESIPGELMNLLVLLSFSMGHDELEIVPTPGNVEIN